MELNIGRNTLKYNQLELFDKSIKERLLTVDEVAGLLKMSPSTIRDWVYKGKIPSLKVNGAVRFNATAIERWITEEADGDSNS